MKRRSFLKTAGSVIAASTLPKAASAAVPASSRVVLPMNRNWRYYPAKGRRCGGILLRRFGLHHRCAPALQHSAAVA